MASAKEDTRTRLCFWLCCISVLLNVWAWESVIGIRRGITVTEHLLRLFRDEVKKILAEWHAVAKKGG
jgi:hypothetical protein